MKYEIVKEGTCLKFTQATEHGGDLRRKLLETGDRVLAEAARSDPVWGIGCNEKKADAKRERWGQNLLGNALVDCRRRLREEG